METEEIHPVCIPLDSRQNFIQSSVKYKQKFEKLGKFPKGFSLNLTNIYGFFVDSSIVEYVVTHHFPGHVYPV